MSRPALVALTCLAVSSLASAGPAPSGGAAELLARAETITTPALRLERLTAPLLGLPYGDSPLGEGEGIDPDPRVRWDVFDCVTFVETAMALAAAPHADALLPVLDDIRYGELPVSFRHRNHFVEAQWIPNNLRKGYVRDVTAAVGGERIRVAAKQFDQARWNARRQRGLQLADDEIPLGLHRVDMLGLEEARRLVDRIAPGTLLFVVRKDFYTEPTRITHVGLVVETRRGRMLRHASRTFGKVVDEPLAAFLERHAAYRRWPVEGVSLYEVQVPRDRVARLAGPLEAGSETALAGP